MGGGQGGLWYKGINYSPVKPLPLCSGERDWGDEKGREGRIQTHAPSAGQLGLDWLRTWTIWKLAVSMVGARGCEPRRWVRPQQPQRQHRGQPGRQRANYLCFPLFLSKKLKAKINILIGQLCKIIFNLDCLDTSSGVTNSLLKTKFHFMSFDW